MSEVNPPVAPPLQANWPEPPQPAADPPLTTAALANAAARAAVSGSLRDLAEYLKLRRVAQRSAA